MKFLLLVVFLFSAVIASAATTQATGFATAKIIDATSAINTDYLSDSSYQATYIDAEENTINFVF